MGLCILGMGECGNKTDVKSISNITNINKTMSNMVSTRSQSVRATQINTQNMKVKVLPPPGYDASTWGPLIKNCSFVNNQTMDASQKVSVTLDTTDTKALQNQVSSALKAASDTSVKQKTDLFQTAPNELNSYTSVNQVIDNLVSVNISDTVTSELKQLMKNAQNNSLEIYGPVDCGGKTLSENTQKMLTSQISETLTKALTGTTLANALKSSADSEIKNTADQEGGGLTGFVKGFFEGLGSLLTGPAIIIGVIIVGLLAFVFIFKDSIGGFLKGAVKITPMGMMADSIAKDSSKAINKFGRKLGFKFGKRR
jgi:hypothetical protein